VSGRPGLTADQSGHRPAPPGAGVRRRRAWAIPVGRDRRQDGSALVVALAFALVVVLTAMAAIDVGGLVVARAGVQTAADLAALAALTPGPAPPRQAAEAVAAANRARLASCDCEGEEAVVRVERVVRLLPAGPSVRLPARARAILPVRPLFPAAPGGGGAGGQAGGAAFGSDDTGAGVAGARALLHDPRLVLSPNARGDLAAGRVDRRLLGLLAAILRRHRVAVGVFRTGHSRFVAGTTVVSKHAHGRAMDIFEVDGGLVRRGHTPSLELVRWLAGLRGPRRPSEVGSPFPQFEEVPGHFSNRAHLDHVHIAVG